MDKEHELQLRISALEKENKRLQTVQVEQKRILESLEIINTIILNASDLDGMLGQILQQFLEFFSCDRAWLLYPCDPEAETYCVPMEQTRPQWLGANTLGIGMPTDDFARRVFTSVLETLNPLRFDPENNPLDPAEPINAQMNIRSQMLMAIRPNIGKPWLLGIHHCAVPTVYSQNDYDLFETLGNRLADGLSSLLSWQKTKNLFETADIAIWDQDLSAIYNALETLRRNGVTDLRRYLRDNDHVVWELAAKVKVLQVNAATLDLFCAKKEEHFLFQIDKSWGDNAIEVFADELCAIWNRHKFFRSEANFRTLDGRDLTAIISFQIPETEDGFSSVPVCITDITERKQAEAELELHRNHLKQLVATRTAELKRAKDAAEVANKAKGTFLANMSHEVRTPMNGLLSVVKVLKNTQMTNEQMTCLEMVERSGKRMVAILNDILDYSLLEEGVKPAHEPVQLNQLVADVVELFSEQAKDKGLKLKTDLPDNLPLVEGDHKLLQQLLNNLVSNAIKYTETGFVTLSITTHYKERQGCFVIFSVKDSGIGIPEKMQQYIFRRFQQLEDCYSREQEGLGLGLSICEQIADAMNGDLSVSAEEGVGSEFKFSLLMPVIDAISSEKIAEDKLGIKEQLHILLVEDEPIARFATRSLLEYEGHEVIEAGNGYEALQIINDKISFDIILMDVHMPGMDGLEATKKIRDHQNKIVRDKYIIGLTASATLGELEVYLEAGMNKVVTKPFLLSDLGKAISERVQ